MHEEKDQNAAVTRETEPQEARENVLKLNRPVRFEGIEYAEIDLSGLARLTIADAVDAQRRCQEDLAAATVCATTTVFAREIAVKATGMPVEFFKLMPRGASRQVVRAVQAHMNTVNGTENHVMKLEKPYYFDGEHTEIDLNGLASLTAMNESEAENLIAREGFVILETSANYLYICCLAGMATGKPVKFFTGLPLCELIKLKNAVNDADFFG